MDKLLATFSGRYGDILWSLATVRQLALHNPEKEIDFGIMPQYATLVPLLQAQHYISKAFTIPDWVCTGSPFGDQPWEAPVPAGYDSVCHLTYRYHPNEPLIDATLRTAGLAWDGAAQPFIFIDGEMGSKFSTIAVGFNEHHGEAKKEFLRELTQWLWRLCPIEALRPHLVDVTKMPWVEAAQAIKTAKFFLGCRSSQAVLAHGLGQRCLIYEPALERRPAMFGNPHGTEVMPALDDMDAFIRTAGAWLT